MGKGKNQSGVQGRHNYSRASYLYQAATYLAAQVQDDHDGSLTTNTGHDARPQSEREKLALQNMSRQAIADMRAVTLKAQIRQNAGLKRTMCKFCNMLQLEGKTCTSLIENHSKQGSKPWADVLVVRCKTCGNAKRFPVCAVRQKRRSLREEKVAALPTREQKPEVQVPVPGQET